MKPLTLALLGLVFSVGVKASELPETHFFGYTPFFNTCANWVISAGYKTVRYGGYVNGWYRYDACWGTDPKPQPQNPEVAATPLLTNIRFVQVQSKLLLTRLLADKGYESLYVRAEKLENASKILQSAAEDGLSKAQLKQFYEDVKFAYEMITYDYYPVHVKIQNAQVGEAWKELVKGFEKIKADFETYE